MWVDMDWIDTFQERFASFAELATIREDKFHGSVTINFHAGVPVNIDIKKHYRAEKKEEDDNG